jgi:alpha-L-fucosidase
MPTHLSIAACLLLSSFAADASTPSPRASTPFVDAAPLPLQPETEAERDERMRWWRESRFGMFIHWGLYAIPAGVWEGRTIPGAGEWIMNSAQITPAAYEPLIGQFDPVKFDAKRWVEIAKNAGMKYIVITSKHHDGFCLWDSALTEWDVGGTPFKRDILKELADACTEAGIRLCFYHSIMDWHHPDYLPRRAWDARPTDDADFDRYREYMKGQIAELLSGRFGDIGVLWFDGEWESTWNHEFGKDLDDHVRGLKRDIIVNNRVDVGREGMVGFSKEPKFRGDFGTPEQQIPATGMPGTDWETCMTMNDTWGFHQHDHNWKSKETLIRMLVDIASKGGNFLLNVGPTALGEIPPESIERLAAIGAWMKVNGESIHGTSASPFASLSFGRATTKPIPNGTRLYLHVFDWPASGSLEVPGILNATGGPARLLDGGEGRPLETTASDGMVRIALPPTAPDPIASVIALDLVGEPRILRALAIEPADDDFVEAVQITPAEVPEGVVVRITTDGSEPTAESREFKAIALRETATVKVRAFVGDAPVGPIVERTFTKATPWEPYARKAGDLDTTFRWVRVEGDFTDVASLRAKLPPLEQWKIDPRQGIAFPPGTEDRVGVAFRGLLRVDFEAMWRFRLTSDDGSRLYIDGNLVVDNDGLHSLRTVEGSAPLAKGLHLIEVFAFERDGQHALELLWNGPGIDWKPITAENFLRRPVGTDQPARGAPAARPPQRPERPERPERPAPR